MRKIENKIYDIYSENINAKIAHISDLHYTNNFDQNILIRIYNDLYFNKPNYICITGDIVDNANIFENKNSFKNLLDWFEKLGNIAQTFIILGNHDFSIRENHKTKFSFNSNWIKKINKIKNVYLLHNEIFETKKIRFLGYTQPFNYYYAKNKEDKSIKILSDDFEKNFKQINKLESKFNILLCHCPMYIIDIKQIKQINLILSGHMHNGMILPFMDKLFKENYGIISPNGNLFPKRARGKINIENGPSLFISGGITKIQQCAPFILRPLNNLFPINVDYINIKPKA